MHTPAVNNHATSIIIRPFGQLHRSQLLRTPSKLSKTCLDLGKYLASRVQVERRHSPGQRMASRNLHHLRFLPSAGG
jgi:hypothetical protein